MLHEFCGMATRLKTRRRRQAPLAIGVEGIAALEVPGCGCSLSKVIVSTPVTTERGCSPPAIGGIIIRAEDE